MIRFDLKKSTINLTLQEKSLNKLIKLVNVFYPLILFVILTAISLMSYWQYLDNGYGLAYNDARSHLDIGRRVVENLKPGLAQLGSVWLPLPHFLMLFTIWNDFMWHTGLSGALQSMIAYVATGCLIYSFLRRLNVGLIGTTIGIAVFATNLNVLYLQSTAMTELLLLATMTAGVYELLIWHKEDNLYSLIKSAFWVMLATLIRYDGWFLFFYSAALVFVHVFLKGGYKKAEGSMLIFATLGAFGIGIWLLWNQIIFKDMFYFISGPYSAATQQLQLEKAGALPTKHNAIMSFVTYFYAVTYNTSFFLVLTALIGAVLFFKDKKISREIKFAGSALLAPFAFNVLALYLGQSVLYVQNLNGSWFNVRYGLMMIPSMAIFIGYLMDKAKPIRPLFISLFILISFFTIVNRDIVTLDDALIGASGKNVREVSGWLKHNAGSKKGYVLISVASHDAIIFSSGMSMNRFIHEGTGDYWKFAIKNPSRWARWIIMRTYDQNDMTYSLLQKNKEWKNRYTLMYKYPFADIYELKPEYVPMTHTKPVNFANR